MHYLGYRELENKRKIYCLRTEKVGSRQPPKRKKATRKRSAPHTPLPTRATKTHETRSAGKATASGSGQKRVSNVDKKAAAPVAKDSSFSCMQPIFECLTLL